MNNTIYSFEVKTLEGEVKTLAEYRGKVLLIVNVASLCGFTSQYSELEALYKKYKVRGFVVLGFPCNQFGNQEPGNANEIRNFCSTHYHITFPLFAKIDVNKQNAHPLYQFLKKKQPGLFGTESIKWNFTKFLISREGVVLKRFPPFSKPKSCEKSIESALNV